jgi:hypothetical protein
LLRSLKRFDSVGLLGLKGFLDLSVILALCELASARLLVCWLKFCGLLDYNVILLASGLSSSQNGLLITLIAPNNAKITLTTLDTKGRSNHTGENEVLS